MIRRAQLQDVAAIEELLLKLKRRTEMVTIKVEFERARKMIRQCVSSPQGFAAVAERKDKISGVLLGLATFWWFSSDRYACDLAFYSRYAGDGDALMTMFKGWADDKHATLYMGQPSGLHIERLKKFYAKWGLKPIGTVFMGERPIAVRAMRSA